MARGPVNGSWVELAAPSAEVGALGVVAGGADGLLLVGAASPLELPKSTQQIGANSVAWGVVAQLKALDHG